MALGTQCFDQLLERQILMRLRPKRRLLSQRQHL
ncbi:hypothetical protein DUGA2_64580 [Duganella sp. HH101]|nr:hypothetical protein DUGA2_64580 [Duganella sp. HH101]